MKRIEILVEELSMKEFLTILLPKIIEHPWQLNQNYFIRSFEGKNDLIKNIPPKIKAFSKQNNVGVVILIDQDSNDCKKLKQKLVDICVQNGNCPTLIRIVCKELEAWYIGDFKAISQAYPNFNSDRYIGKAKFRNPDELSNVCYEIQKILPEFQKVGGAKKIASFINIQANNSVSFKQTIHGLKKFFEKI